MFRLSVTSLLVLTISASFVFAIEVFEADTTNLQNGPLVSAVKKNDNQTKESPRTHEELHGNITTNNSTVVNDQPKSDSSKKEVKNSSATTTLTIQNATASSTQKVSQNLTKPIEETIPIAKEESVTSKVRNFTGAQSNLNQHRVTPLNEKDEDANTTTTTIKTPKEKASSVGSTSGTTPSSTVVTLKSTSVTAADDIDPSKVTKDVKSIKTASGDTMAKNSTIYETVPPESIDVTEATATKTSNASATTTIATITSPNSTPTTLTTTTTTTPPPPPTTTTTTTTITTTTPTTIAATVITNATATSKNNQMEGKNNTTTLEGLEPLQAELSEKDKESSDGSKGGSMPSGIIALVTAITFAVAIVIGYISMVVWKQYLEHRYGHRELLVNELEFDTNDLRHFEL